MHSSSISCRKKPLLVGVCHYKGQYHLLKMGNLLEKLQVRLIIRLRILSIVRFDNSNIVGILIDCLLLDNADSFACLR